MKSKKIIIFCASLRTGGAERVLSVLSKPFADNFEYVEYLMWYDAPVFYEIDSRVHLVSVAKECGSNNNLKKIRWFRKYIKKCNPNLLISFAAPFNMLALSALLFLKIPVVVAERNDPDAFRWGKILKKIRDCLYHRAKGILVQTETSKNYFKGSSLNKKVDIIPNPIFLEAATVGSALSTEKRPLVVTAARLARQKRHDLLIETFSEFRITHPEYQLCIFGAGKEEKRLQKLIVDLKQEEHIFLPGKVQNLWDLIKPAKMFVMTSLFEGMSNSLIEAMCLGLPCVSTRVSGAADLIVNQKNGILIDIDDRNALLESMTKIADDSSFAASLGKEACKLYDELNVERISDVWIRYIKKQIVDKDEL